MFKVIKNKINKKTIIGTLLIFISVLIISSIIWGNRTFSVKTLPQIIFHTKVPMDGTDNGIYWNWALWCLPISIFITMGVDMIIFNMYKVFTTRWKEKIKHVTNHLYKISSVFVIVALVFTLSNYNVFGYLGHITQETDIYESYYVNPKEANISFPNGKRNLIHIYLESIENTYLSDELGGGQKENYMLELGELANNNINFSNTDKIGGPLTIDGTQWTIASMVGQSAGIPLALPLLSKNYDKNSTFMPGAYTIGDVLKKEGYNQELLSGSDADFAVTSNFYEQHGDYTIMDYKEAKKQGRINDDYFVFWGYEDKKLFQFAKEDITSLANKEEPFNIELVTIDSHTPDGYRCEDCPDTFDSQYKNVIACQSKQVNDFVSWVKQQDFYENTTIVITGDHKSMASKFFEDLDSDYVRTPYNVFINSAVDTKNMKNRQFSIVDMYPTILASIGAKIEGDRLGLGTNLFSDKKTIMEEIGFTSLNDEVQKKSKYYDEIILGESK